MATVGVVGLNYWGPNLVRNFDDLAELAWLCDLDEGLRPFIVQVAVDSGSDRICL